MKDSTDRTTSGPQSPLAGMITLESSVKNKDTMNYFNRLMEDIFVMMNFSRRMGISIPVELQKEISTLLYDEEKTFSSNNNDSEEKASMQANSRGNAQ